MTSDPDSAALADDSHALADDSHALADGALGSDTDLGDALPRVVALMARLRRDCPWDAEQTPRSLVKHLIEETAETVDAIESGTDADLVEELGDVLLQVVFHAEIARGDGRFDIDDVANSLVNKLIARHPWVFGDDAAPSHDNMMATWEGAKKVAKKRDSALDGIADALPTLARAAKVATRLRDNHVDAAFDMLDAPDDFGPRLLALVVEAVQAGADPDQALRDTTRAWETDVRAAGL